MLLIFYTCFLQAFVYFLCNKLHKNPKSFSFHVWSSKVMVKRNLDTTLLTGDQIPTSTNILKKKICITMKSSRTIITSCTISHTELFNYISFLSYKKFPTEHIFHFSPNKTSSCTENQNETEIFAIHFKFNNVLDP
jgi:hypothetical protein